MPRSTTPQRTIIAALAASALLSSPAIARPADDDVNRSGSPTSSLAGTVSPRQDLRGEHARDAARAAEGPFVTGLPAPAVQPAPVSEAPKTALAANSGGDDDVWLVLGIGLAGAGIIAGSAAGVARHHRLRSRGVAA